MFNVNVGLGLAAAIHFATIANRELPLQYNYRNQAKEDLL